MIVSHGEGVDPGAAFLHLGLPPSFGPANNRAGAYEIILPEGVTEAQFIDALALDPDEVRLNHAKAEAGAKVRDNARPAMMDGYPDVEPIVARRDALLALIDAAQDIEALNAIDLTV